MTSWANNRTHFKKTVSSPSIISITSNEFPSKYILNKTYNDAVICAIALNEERYIDEWIQYNLFLGFSHIYIYDNSSNNVLKNKKSDRVTIIHIPGAIKQLEAYNIFTVQYKTKHIWCAFIDCDEFIVLKKHDNIISFLNEYNNCASVALSWLMFGTSNETEYRNEPVSKRFLYCANKTDIHIKSIAKLSNISNYVQPHSPELKNGYNMDTNRNVIIGPFNYNGDDKIACIHHYYTKSEEEFKQKIIRGRADIVQKRGFDELQDIHSKNNDIYNSDAWNFYSQRL